MMQQRNDWQARREQIRADAMALVEASPSTEDACRTIAEVIEELATGRSVSAEAGFDQLAAVASIAGRLRDRGSTEWANAIERRPQQGPGPGPAECAVDILVGRATGRVCGAAPDERRFIFVRQLREVIPFESADFVAAGEAALKTNPGAIGVLRAMLQQRVADFQGEPRRLAAISDRELEQLSRLQSFEMRFIDIWDDPQERGLVWLHDFDAYELLRRLDLEAYLDLLEDFPLRGAVYQLLDAADAGATTSDLCLLLAKARLIFDSNGNWIKQNRVACIVLNLLAGRLLPEPLEDGKPSENFKAAMTEIIGALTGRPDATLLGYAWLQRVLMSPGRTRRRSAMREDDGDLTISILAVAENLAARLAPHPDPLKWIEAEFYVWRNWRVYALLGVELFRQPLSRNAIADLIADVLKRGLASSVGLDRLGTRPNVERVIVASAMVQVPDPANWFANVWVRLFWQRDRFRWLGHNDASRPNIGQVAVLWGTCGLEGLQVSDESRSLWLALYDAVRESLLTEAFHQHNDAWSIALRYLAALWLKTFPNEPPAGTPGSLEDLVSPWMRIDVSFAQLIEVLDRYEVAPERLRQTGVSGDLLRRIIGGFSFMGRTLLSPEEISTIEAVAERLDRSQGQTTG
jgi:hypothetical protein